MNNKLSMPDIAELLAAATGETKKVCEEFLRELFAIVGEALAGGESVRIKRFGTFKICDIEQRKSVDVSTGDEINIPPHKRIAFIPAKEMAERVNREFEMFFPVELADGVTDEMLAAGDAPVADEPAAGVASPEGVGIADAADDSSEAILPVADNVVAESESYVSQEPEEPLYEEEEEIPTRRKSKSWLKFSLGLVVGAALVFGWNMICEKNPSWWHFAGQDKIARKEKPATPAVQTATVPATDTLPEQQPADDVPTKPSDAPVYDTITPTRYLTTLAREYYGDYRLWPYIYEANKEILGHPDHIRPGTRVVVPSLAAIGVSADSKADVEKAQKMSEKIYSIYKK